MGIFFAWRRNMGQCQSPRRTDLSSGGRQEDELLLIGKQFTSATSQQRSKPNTRNTRMRVHVPHYPPPCFGRAFQLGFFSYAARKYDPSKKSRLIFSKPSPTKP